MKNKTEIINTAIKGKTERPERLTLRKSRDMLYEKFRTNLRVLRGSTAITAVELAAEIGLKSGARLTELEYGKGAPCVEEILNIANYFQITMDDILNKEAVITFK